MRSSLIEAWQWLADNTNHSVVAYTGINLPYYPDDLTGDRAGSMCPVQRLAEAGLGTKRGDTRLTGLLKDIPILKKVLGVEVLGAEPALRP